MAIYDQKVFEFVKNIFEEDMHAKRVLSLANGTIGVIASGSLAIHAIGKGLAAIRGTIDKHSIKQVDRLLSNEGIDIDKIFSIWIPYVIGSCREFYINLDWTDFDDDSQTTLVASLQTDHGRTIPLRWKTVNKNNLKGMTNQHENDLLRKIAKHIPEGSSVTIVADRGFADLETFSVIRDELKMDFIIRFKASVLVENNKGETKCANDWIGTYGHMRVLRNTKITAQKYDMQTVVCVCRKGMKEAWCIASSRDDLDGNKIIFHYNKRFSIEETFRDVKDLHYGMGLSWTNIKDQMRRDKLLLLAVLAQTLLSILGQAGEDVKMDRYLKVNTSKKRTLSLVKQGLRWYDLIPNMRQDRFDLLIGRFNELIYADELMNYVFYRGLGK